MPVASIVLNPGESGSVRIDSASTTTLALYFPGRVVAVFAEPNFWPEDREDVTDLKQLVLSDLQPTFYGALKAADGLKSACLQTLCCELTDPGSVLQRGIHPKN